MAMQRETRQSFVLSIMIHGGFVIFAVLFLLMEHWLERPEPVVFELVSPAAASPAVREQPAETIPDTPIEELQVPDTQPIREAPDIPDLPEPVVEQPAPRPEPVRQPEPEPVRTISAQEFFRNRDRPERVQEVQQRPRPRPVPAPTIESNVRQRLERQISDIQLIGADIGQVESQDALLRYLAELRRRVQSVFEPSGSNLKAEVHFKVTSGGRILSPRIQSSSGVPAFDESVLRALQVTRAPGPPPGNKDYDFSLVFRSE